MLFIFSPQKRWKGATTSSTFDKSRLCGSEVARSVCIIYEAAVTPTRWIPSLFPLYSKISYAVRSVGSDSMLKDGRVQDHHRRGSQLPGWIFCLMDPWGPFRGTESRSGVFGSALRCRCAIDQETGRSLFDGVYHRGSDNRTKQGAGRGQRALVETPISLFMYRTAGVEVCFEEGEPPSCACPMPTRGWRKTFARLASGVLGFTFYLPPQPRRRRQNPYVECCSRLRLLSRCVGMPPHPPIPL